MFTPTKEQLEEFGFKESIWWDMKYESDTFNILWDITTWYSKFTLIFLNHMKHRKWEETIYPTSFQDIQTLIRLLSPNN